MLGAKMLLRMRKEIDKLKLRRRHLAQQIVLRYQGLNHGVVIWETTLELVFKVALYVALTGLWWTWGCFVDMYLSSLGEESRLYD